MGKNLKCFLLWFIFSCYATTSFSADRVALVIGNGAYQFSGKLTNPANDARAISQKLRGLGFDVIEGTDLDKPAFEQAIRTFSSKLPGASTALFFYAGHGMQINGQNYLLPISAQLKDELSLNFETIPFDIVMKTMGSGLDRVNLIFLDACRDNPFVENLARTMGLSRSESTQRGLAPQERTTVGTLIAYATQPNNTALDGDGDHSPFTLALLENIDRPGITISTMLQDVRRNVLQQTKNKQVPWEHSSLTNEFYMAGSAPLIPLPPQIPSPLPERRVISDDLSNVPGLSDAFKQKYQLAANKGSEGTELALNEALDLVKTLVPLATSDVAADRVVKLGSRLREELDRVVAIRQKQEADIAEQQQKEANRRAQQLAEEQRLLAEKQRQLNEARRRAEAEQYAAAEAARRVAEANALKKIKAQVDDLLRQVKMLAAAGDEKGAAKKLREAQALLPDDPDVIALMKVVKIEPDYRIDPKIGMAFVFIPGGCYTMGKITNAALENDNYQPLANSWDSWPWFIKWPLIAVATVLPSGCSSANGYRSPTIIPAIIPDPIKDVCVKNFWMGKYEVTFEEYDRFADATHRAKPKDNGWGRGKRPVINVSWDDATAYAEWASAVTGKHYRLPTEAEWEYAARAGTNTAYWWGNEIGHNHANCDRCGSQWDNKQTAPVGSFPPNPFGLYDTAGNVWEWTCSEYRETYDGGEQLCTNPSNNNGVRRSLRGGSWFDFPDGVRSAYRGRNAPGYRFDFLGFRLSQD